MELTTMSEPISTELSPLSSIIIRIITNHIYAIEAFAATSTNSLNDAILLSYYENASSLTRTPYSSKNLNDQCATLATKNEDLILKRDATIANCNTLTTQVTQLKAQLVQTLALTNISTNLLPTSCKGQTNPKKFTGEDSGKLRSFVALLCLHLIDCPGEFPNEQSKLQCPFPRLEGATLEQLIHLMKDDYVNLGNIKAFVTLLEEVYRGPNYVNTAKWALAQLCQGNQDFVTYYAKFQCLTADLN
jgi:hypothetical protein